VRRERRNRERSPQVERVQTGLRMEKRLIKMLKALAEFYDLSLGELVETAVVGWFGGGAGVSERAARTAAELARLYEMELKPASGSPLIEGRAQP
jgi:hypothetical protein